ncbi:MAG: DUF2807 domain-containing protein [Prevotellaceae bacterium]|jgi:phage shock protein PspC (stress-responsive transcriptional regulator)|nr:DUF2807 domain-containing protein [Prevotellaceae bacterium]
MKKTLTINLNGRVFNIDEDAYALLENYLKNLKTYFSKELGSAEIMNDFEERISEIFSGKIAQGYDVINIDDVEQTISQMGRPSDFDETQEKESAFQQFEAGNSSNTQRAENQPRGNKKLFRDPHNKMIGGVCSGIAAYLNCDTTWVRLGFVVLFFCTMPLLKLIFLPGWLTMLYLALWIVVPQAKTAEQRLQMTGEPVTLENIGKTVAAQANAEIPTANGGNNNGCAGTFLKICLIVIVGIPVLFSLTLVLIIVFAVLFGVGTGVLGGLIPFTNETFLVVNRPEMAVIGTCLLVGIPIFVLIYSIIAAIFKWKPAHKWLKISGLVIWILSIFLVIGAGWKADWKQIANGNNLNIGWGDFHFDGKNVRGDGNIKTKTESIPFMVKTVEIQGGFDVDLQIDSVAGNVSGVEIKTDSNLIDKIVFDKSDRNLTIKPLKNFNLEPTQRIVIHLQSSELNSVILSGSSDINFYNNFNNNDLSLSVLGSGNLNFSDLAAKNLKIAVNGSGEVKGGGKFETTDISILGSGDVELSGKSRYSKFQISGSGNISACELLADTVKANTFGSGDIYCNATALLDAKTTGSGDIIYQNEPKSKQISSLGSGDILKK